MKIIVDTSIWIEYLKNKPNLVEILEKEMLAGNVYLVGPVVSELLQGAKTEKDLTALSNNIDGIPYIEASFKDWQFAGRISYDLRKKGVTVPITDCLIASLAINNQASVFTSDRHFQKIPGVKLLG